MDSRIESLVPFRHDSVERLKCITGGAVPRVPADVNPGEDHPVAIGVDRDADGGGEFGEPGDLKPLQFAHGVVTLSKREPESKGIFRNAENIY